MCVFFLYDVLVSLLSPNWEYNDRAGSKLTYLIKTKGVQILSTLLVLPEHFLCSQTAHCAYSRHIPRCSILPRDHWKGRWPTPALNGILLILKKIKRLPRDCKNRRWRTWLHWIGPYWFWTEESWSQRSKQKEHQNQSDHFEKQITVLWSPKWNIQWCRKLWQIFSLGKKMSQALP